MAVIAGPGPVFVFERLTGARRWQVYAWRALFVTALLMALAVTWESESVFGGMIGPAQTRVAVKVYRALVGTQLALVLMAAPAATAGAVCLDKARGTLAHVLVTDLSNGEIVLGKLGARLIPVLMFVGCTMPVAFLCTLLGGMDPDALLAAFAVTVGVAVLGCSLALTLSIWARKTHEVLLATYVIWAICLLASPAVSLIAQFFGSANLAQAFEDANPFMLAFAPYDRPNLYSPWEIVGFVACCMVFSGLLLARAVTHVRRVAVRQASRTELPRRPARVRLPRWALPAIVPSKLVKLMEGPTLDGNPVLWREWFRNRPSGWARTIWGVYVAGCVAFTLIAFVSDVGQPPGFMRGRVSLWVNGLQVAIGLLFLSVGAATSLAEERVRGSLDVLMATPLSTRSIVWGKWLGTFRMVPRLALLPGLLAFGLAWKHGNSMEVIFLLAEIAAYGALITSLGLALATRTARLSTAVCTSIMAYVMLTVATFFILAVVVRDPPGERMFAFSPFGGPAILTLDIANNGVGPREPSWAAVRRFRPLLFVRYGWETFAIVVYGTAALMLYRSTLRAFDRCLGRASSAPDGLRVSRRKPRDVAPGSNSPASPVVAANRVLNS